MYECGDCGRILDNVGSESMIRCPYCGYRVVYKTRPPVAKKVVAR